MRTRTSLLLLAALALFAGRGAFAADSGPDPKFHIYLCFGQSNMEGGARPEAQDQGPVDPRFQMMAVADSLRLDRKAGQWYPATSFLQGGENRIGLVDFFGRTLVAHLPPDHRVGVIKVAVPGARIELWERDACNDYLNEAPDWMKNICKQYGDNPYQRLVDMARVAQKDGVIRGILLHQGESNPNDADWCRKVKGIYDNLVQDLNLRPEAMPLLAGELVGVEENGKCSAFNTNILANLPKMLPNTHIISSQGCKGTGDGLHFALEGFRELGERYARQMLKLHVDRVEPAATTAAPHQR